MNRQEAIALIAKKLELAKNNANQAATLVQEAREIARGYNIPLVIPVELAHLSNESDEDWIESPQEEEDEGNWESSDDWESSDC